MVNNWCRRKSMGGVRNNDYLEEPNCSTNGRPGSIISYTYQTKIETRSCISCERWDINHNLGLLRSFFEINNCAVSKFCTRSQQLTTSKDISARTLGHSATKHGSQVTTVLHWVVCCEGWVHPCWVHFLWEFPGCWNVLARKVCICINVPGRLCSEDNRTVTKLCFPFLLTWVQFTEITHLLVEFLVQDHLRDGILFLLDVKQALTTKYAEGVARRACTLQPTEDVLSYLVQNQWWRMHLFTRHLTRPFANPIVWRLLH